MATKTEARTQRMDQMSPTLDPKAMTVTVAYQERNGKGEFDTKAEKVFKVEDLPESIKDMCILYGISKKLADSTSSGKSLGIMGVAKLDWMGEIWANLCAGDWNMKRAGGGRSASVDIYLAMVVADLKKISLEAATAALQAFPKEQRDQLATKYKEEIAAKRKAAEAEAVDLDDLL